MKLFNDLDFGQHQALNLGLQQLASDPGSPVEGQIWENTTSHVVKAYINGTVITFSSGGGITNAYSNISDGSVTAAAIGSDTVTFSSANSRLTIAAVNAGAGADTVTWTLVESAIVHNNLSGLTTGDPHTQYVLLAGRTNQVIYGSTGSAGTLSLSSTSHATKGTINFGNAVFDEVNSRLYLGPGGSATYPLTIDNAALNTSIAIDCGSGKIINVLDPTAAQHAATKNYVDLAIQGTPLKNSAAYATTAALAANTYANGASGVGATLTGNANGALASIDGQTIVAADIVFVKNEATTSHNGLYTVTQVGDGSHPYILTRQTGMDQSVEFGGAVVAVENGTTNAGSLWMCTTNAPTVGTTSLTFVEINKAADLQAGTGITLSGNTVSVATNYAGGASIVTVGTVTTGTWSATTIAVARGGTGQMTAANARGTSGIGADTAAAAATNVTASDSGIPTMKKFMVTHTGSATSFTLTHNLNNTTPLVQIYDNSGNAVIVDFVATDANTITVTWAAAQANTTVFKVVVIG